MCIASTMISKIAAWRNPLGSEENWPPNPEQNPVFPSYSKLALSEIGFALAATVACVESVVYFFFQLGAACLNLASQESMGVMLSISVDAVGWSLDLVFGDNFQIANLRTKDLPTRITEYCMRANEGDREAQFNLAVCYATGRGIGKDLTQAFQWYRRAAEQGHAHAQCNVGYCYGKGRGVEQDDAQAIYWSRRAAEQGNTLAQSNLRTLEERQPIEGQEEQAEGRVPGVPIA